MKYTKRIKNRFSQKSSAPSQPQKDWLQLLTHASPLVRDTDHRVKMTISCRDSDYIPKVKDAGKIITKNGQKYQIMHNGLVVESGGYFGDWMGEIIKTLKGHHEPQEEKVFYELLKRIPSDGTMIELGAYWAYYSLWFNKAVKNGVNYCCEPDPVNLELGQRNAAANKAQNMHFIPAAAGSDHNAQISFTPQEGEGRADVSVPIKSVDGLMKEEKIKRFDIVHMDVQGAELTALEGARESIRKGKVRFVMVSTHHYLISGDPLMHEKCLQFIKDMGGYVVAEHAIHESFSGDGLIVASFDKRDKDLAIEISENRMDNNLFRSYTEDLDVLIKGYEDLRQKLS